MQRNRLIHGELMVVLLLLLGLGCTHPRQALEVVPEPAPSPGRTGPGPWLLQLKHTRQWTPPLSDSEYGVTITGKVFIKPRPGHARVETSDLWVRTPSGDAGYALTQTGRVVVLTPFDGTLGWNSVAISPDGGQVAYVEHSGPPGTFSTIWRLLWVVNADGSGRRLLVDLRERMPPDASAGPISWSSDGSRVVYVLYSRSKTPPAGESRCPLATVYSVDLTTGLQEILFKSSKPEWIQPRGWFVERGEFSFSSHCDTPTELPWPADMFVTHRMGERTAAAQPSRGSPSPDGQHLLLLPSSAQWRQQFGHLLLDGQALEVPPDFESFIVQRVTWMHGRPTAYISTYRGYGGNCITPMSQPPPALYRLEVEGNTRPRVERLTESPLLVLDFSPDDAHVLLAVVARSAQGRDGCARHAFDSLLVAERSRFETSTSLEELLSASVRVDEPSSSIGRDMQGVIGWLR